jgi:Undecaprenyl-phosphate glucose phosphotransferase
MNHSYPPTIELNVAHTAAPAVRYQGRRIPAVIFIGVVRTCDRLLLLLCGSVSWEIAARLLGVAPTGGDLLASLIAAWVAMICLDRGDAYRMSRLLSYAAQFRWLSICIAAGGAALVGSKMIVHGGAVPAPVEIGTWLALSFVALGLTRIPLVHIAKRLRRERRLARRVALLGSTEVGRAFLAQLRGHEDGEIDLVGLYDDTATPDAVARANLPFLGGVHELVAHSQTGMLDALVITLPAGDGGRVADLSERLSHLVLDVYVAPDLAGSPFSEISSFCGVPVGLLARRPLSEWQAVQKGLFDRIVAGMMLIVLGPLLALIALVVRLDSPGPALFRQRRIGFNNRPFNCLKFRTMYNEMADALADRQTTRVDQRITRVGIWLRRLSLDELPQLLNVLRGEMSLVGPRPHAPNTKAASRLFQDVVADYARRHRVKPGITGWAQVNGWRGETSTEEEIEQRVRHDLHYIQNWSLTWDMRILLMTAVRVCGDPKAF